MHSLRSIIDEPAYLSEAELASIQHARDWPQLRERVLRTLSAFDVDDFMLRIGTTLPNGEPQVQAFGSLPESLLARFRDAGEDDPVDARAAGSGLPFEWEINDVCERSGAPGYLQMRMCGVRRGISIALRSERLWCRIDFCRRTMPMFPRSAAYRAHLLLLATYLHEAARGIYGRELDDQVEPLTERELECLRFSAGGKTGKEIGMILGISQRTVYFHMKNIARKFNVYSTRHAIGRAVAVGLIKPGA